MRDLRKIPWVGGENGDGIERGLLVAATVVLKKQLCNIGSYTTCTSFGMTMRLNDKPATSDYFLLE